MVKMGLKNGFKAENCGIKFEICQNNCIFALLKVPEQIGDILSTEK